MRTTEEQRITWELDGGNYGKVNEAVLFGGRLYSSRRELVVAQMRTHLKGIAKILVTLISFVVAMGDRN